MWEPALIVLSPGRPEGLAARFSSGLLFTTISSSGSFAGVFVVFVAGSVASCFFSSCGSVMFSVLGFDVISFSASLSVSSSAKASMSKPLSVPGSAGRDSTSAFLTSSDSVTLSVSSAESSSGVSNPSMSTASAFSAALAAAVLRLNLRLRAAATSLARGCR